MCSQASISNSGSTSCNIRYLLVSGCFIKSILILTYSWLPDAMEGPTPVSSLLHSATLVIAGILTVSYRVTVSIPGEPFIYILCTIGICLLTSSAVNDSDLKRTLAYSTSSMISLLWLLIIVQDFKTVTCIHGIYKSAAFITIGYGISVVSSQDNRYLADDYEHAVYLGTFIYVLGTCGSSYYGVKHGLMGGILAGTSIVTVTLLIVPSWIIVTLLTVIGNSRNSNDDLGISLCTCVSGILVTDMHG